MAAGFSRYYVFSSATRRGEFGHGKNLARYELIGSTRAGKSGRRRFNYRPIPFFFSQGPSSWEIFPTRNSGSALVAVEEKDDKEEKEWKDGTLRAEEEQKT